MHKQSRVSFFCTALITAAFLLSSANAVASAYGEGYDDGYDDAMEDCPCPKILSIYNGLYLGAEGGYENYHVISKGMEFGDFNYNHSAPGWVGDVFVGYGRSLPRNFYLGGEVFVGGSSASGSSTFSTGSTFKSAFSVGTSYGFTFRPGYQLNSTLLHLNLGYARTEFTNKESISGLFINESISNTQWANGFKYGLGFETPICKSVSLRLDYNHISYGSYTDSVTGTKISPSDNQGTFGFAYHPSF